MNNQNTYCRKCQEEQNLCICDSNAEHQPDEYEQWMESRRVDREAQKLITKVIELKLQKKKPTDYKVRRKNQRILHRIKRERSQQENQQLTAVGKQTRKR